MKGVPEPKFIRQTDILVSEATVITSFQTVSGEPQFVKFTVVQKLTPIWSPKRNREPFSDELSPSFEKTVEVPVLLLTILSPLAAGPSQRKSSSCIVDSPRLDLLLGFPPLATGPLQHKSASCIFDSPRPSLHLRQLPGPGVLMPKPPPLLATHPQISFSIQGLPEVVL
uniref:Uncharacterized protein n=1 Tax=Oryza punctata TaxID=4537 RepID=A0A0E0JQ23_ORYPU